MCNLRVLVVTAASLAAASLAAVSDDSTTELDLTPNMVSKACVQSDTGMAGLCVKYSQCRSNHTIDKYGAIDDNEIRVGTCPVSTEWCCVDEDATKSLPLADCLIAKDDTTASVCPWCVTLNRDGGQPSKRNPNGRSCAGVLVGDGGAILTAATCLRAAQKQKLWVEHQGNNYTMLHFKEHPEYNSGTREHDLAVLVLSSRIPGLKGACLTHRTPAGRCRAISFDQGGDWHVMDLEVSEGRCGTRGGAKGAACGRTNDQECRVSLGSPLLCPTPTNDGWTVWGVSRGGGCGSGDKAGAMYSILSVDREWLEPLLPKAQLSRTPGSTQVPDPNLSKYGDIMSDEIRKTP